MINKLNAEDRETLRRIQGAEDRSIRGFRTEGSTLTKFGVKVSVEGKHAGEVALAISKAAKDIEFLLRIIEQDETVVGTPLDKRVADLEDTLEWLTKSYTSRMWDERKY